MRALVTGGAGFVGSHLVNALLAQGDEVTVFDVLPSRNPNAVSFQGDLLTDSYVLNWLTPSRFDVVYHFAAIADPHGSKQHPTWDLQGNLIATAVLLETMRQANVPRIVFASSSSVYGDTSVFPTPEDAPIPNQTSLYGASKMAAEGLISAYCRTFDMHATIFRFAPMLGPGYRRGHVRDFYDKLKRDPSCIEVMGDGKQSRSYVYVKDAMQAVLCAPDGTFNVGSDYAIMVDTSLNYICEAMGVNPRRVYTGQSWAGDKSMTLLDCSRLRSLGWRPTISIREAVMQTVRSFDT